MPKKTEEGVLEAMQAVEQDQNVSVSLEEMEAAATEADAANAETAATEDEVEFPAVEGETTDDVDHVEDNPTPDAVAPEEAPRARQTRPRRASEPETIEGDSDISLTALTPEQTKERNWRLVKQAQTRHMILERQIIGVEPAGQGRAYPRVFVEYNDFRIAISTRDFFDANLFNVDLEKISENERNSREFQMASRMMGAYVPFVITDAQSMFDQESGQRVYAIRASRKEALRRKRENYFFRATPRVKVGSRVKARVLMSVPRGVLMEVVGQEIIVPVRELSSCKWVDPLYDFPAGTVTYVDITRLEIDREKRTIRMEATRKTMDADMAINSYNSIREGVRYIGTVVGVDREYVRINLDCHAKAAAPIIGLNGARLRYGDRVSVNVNRKRDDFMTCYGSCIPIATRPF